MLIKDIQYGIIHKYGEDCHDSLAISSDGRTLSYYNLQNGDGSRFGDYRFVMEDGKVPENSQTPDAIHAECYFNVGGFPSAKQIRVEAIDEYSSKLWQVIEKATVNCKLDFTIDDLHNLEIIIKGLAEELKEQNND